jgi:hypothetical protein
MNYFFEDAKVMEKEKCMMTRKNASNKNTKNYPNIIQVA